MKLDVRALGVAAANVAAVSFILCGLFFRVAPGAAGRFFDLLLHANMGGTWRVPDWGELFLGTVVWWVATAVFVGVTGALYNHAARN